LQATRQPVIGQRHAATAFERFLPFCLSINWTIKIARPPDTFH